MLNFSPKDHVILLVDDEASNIQILNQLLTREQYKVSAMVQPQKLLDMLPQIQPDLILLDVVMPNISGYELCEKIKASPEFSEIPIIFLTAQDDEADLVKGFDAGGADYITKPFSPAELLVRVRTHLILRQQKQRLIQLNEEKNHFLSVASHDIRGPLATILMSAQLMERRAEHLNDDLIQMQQIIKQSAERCLNYVSDLLDVHKIEAGVMEPEWAQVSLSLSLKQLEDLYRHSAQNKKVQFNLHVPDKSVEVNTDAKMLTQILDNLISNAIKYTPIGSEVNVEVLESENQVELSVRDQGRGFSAKDREKMYQKFVRLSAQPTANELSSGLGLSIVKELCDKLGIEIALKDSEIGAHFVLTFPRIKP